MKRRPELEKMVQETLDSLEGIKRAEPLPYFYTRVTGKLQNYTRSWWESMGSFIARPAIAISGLFFILVLNAIMLLRQDNEPTTTIPQLGDNEYILASSNS